MALNRRFVICAVVGLTCWFAAAAAEAQYCVHGGMCRKGLAGCCAPNADIFGYTPTRWRPWPTVTPTLATPTPATEAVPTPAEETPAAEAEQPAPGPEPDQLRITPEESAPFPTEQEREFPETEGTPTDPSVEPETFLPFQDQDQPPAPPSDSPGEPPLEPGSPSPSADAAAKDVPGGEPQLSAPPMDDAPPTMPDEDPFKDDLIQPGSESTTPGEPTSGVRSRGPILSTNGALRPKELRWRATGTIEAGNSQDSPSNAVELRAANSSHRGSAVLAGSKAKPSEPAIATRVRTGSEPSLLPSDVEPRGNPASRGMLPVATPARRNPLRLASAAFKDEERVVPAAWSANASGPAAARMVSRRNPLRDN